MGKKSLKNYKKQEKADALTKCLFQRTVVSDGNNLINHFKGDFDAALLYCLEKKLDDDLFDYIYHCQIDHDKSVEETLQNIERRIDECASDVAVDFQMYSEQRCLDLAVNVSGSDISDLVMYIARKKLFPQSITDEKDDENMGNEEENEEGNEEEDENNEIKWTELTIK